MNLSQPICDRTGRTDASIDAEAASRTLNWIDRQLQRVGQRLNRIQQRCAPLSQSVRERMIEFLDLAGMELEEASKLLETTLKELAGVNPIAPAIQLDSSIDPVLDSPDSVRVLGNECVAGANSRTACSHDKSGRQQLQAICPDERAATPLNIRFGTPFCFPGSHSNQAANCASIPEAADLKTILANLRACQDAEKDGAGVLDQLDKRLQQCGSQKVDLLNLSSCSYGESDWMKHDETATQIVLGTIPANRPSKPSDVDGEMERADDGTKVQFNASLNSSDELPWQSTNCQAIQYPSPPPQCLSEFNAELADATSPATDSAGSRQPIDHSVDDNGHEQYGVLDISISATDLIDPTNLTELSRIKTELDLLIHEFRQLSNRAGTPTSEKDKSNIKSF